MKTLKVFLHERKISAALVLTDGNVILGGHATGLGKYDLPKGGINFNESPIDAVVRETREETGLKINKKDLKDLGVFNYNSTKNLHVFLLKTDNLPSISNMECTSYFTDSYGNEKKEIDGYKYIKVENVDKYMFSNLAKVIKKVIKNENL